MGMVKVWVESGVLFNSRGKEKIHSVKISLKAHQHPSLIVLCCFPDHFSQIEDDNGLLNFPKFEAYLRELLQVCLLLLT